MRTKEGNALASIVYGERLRAQQELALKQISRRECVATTAAAAGDSVLAPHAFGSRNEPTGSDSLALPPQANRSIAPLQAVPFPMKNVRLQPGAFRAAADANRLYLKTLPPDRLLHTFRLTAGLPSSTERLGDWEKPDCELRGHFAGGHYLSACALNLAQRFDKKWVFDALAARRHELKGLHVNTHIPQVLAAARLYELTGDRRYWQIADYFWNEATSERSYRTEGTSNFKTWFQTVGEAQAVTFAPLSSIVHERYSVYNEVSHNSS